MVALIVLAAVAASFLIQRDTTETAQDKARAANVTVCQIGNERGALVAAWQRSAAAARRASGDIKVANDYEAFALGSEENLAIGRYIDNPQQAVQVQKVQSDNGPVYRLTPESKALILKGCERALGD